MSRQTPVNKESRFIFKKTLSVQNKIISDEESTETLVYMVKCAKKIISTNYNYQVFRQMMAEIINSKEKDDLIPSFLCGMEDVDIDHVRKRENMVDKLIDQLLKFLAMKVLLCDNVGYCNNDNDSVDETSVGNVMNTSCTYRLNPSIIIREAWKALLILPSTYEDVCKAYGSDPIDYDDDDDDFLGDKSKTPWSRECYQWTIETYKSLYILPPPPQFWPVLTKA